MLPTGFVLVAGVILVVASVHGLATGDTGPAGTGLVIGLAMVLFAVGAVVTAVRRYRRRPPW